jgi:hypothetical protein
MKKYRGKIRLTFEALKGVLNIKEADIFNVIRTEKDLVSDTMTLLLKSDEPSPYTYEVAEGQEYPEVYIEPCEDFSIREEVRVALDEVCELMLDKNEVVKRVSNDERMLNAITFAIYDAISDILKEKDTHHYEVEYQLDLARKHAQESFTNI